MQAEGHLARHAKKSSEDHRIVITITGRGRRDYLPSCKTTRRVRCSQPQSAGRGSALLCPATKDDDREAPDGFAMASQHGLGQQSAPSLRSQRLDLIRELLRPSEPVREPITW
jgi:hypothetical protein